MTLFCKFPFTNDVFLLVLSLLTIFFSKFFLYLWHSSESLICTNHSSISYAYRISIAAEMWSYLIHYFAWHSHSIEDCDIHYDWHASKVDRLGTIWPHVRTLSQIYVTWAQTEIKWGEQSEPIPFLYSTVLRCLKKKSSTFLQTCLYYLF